MACASPVLALALMTPMARAQAPTPAAPVSAPAPAPLSESLHGTAREAYESAKLLATNRDFAGAGAEFRHAHSLSKDPRLLFNMAICEKELHHYARMQTILGQYLREGAGTATAESVAAAQDALTAIKPLVATLQINVGEAGAEISVDGEPVGTAPLPGNVPVDLGKHQVTVKKDGFDPFEQTLETLGGTEAVVPVTLKAQRHFGQLLVSAEGNATVIVDGQTVGQGRFDGALTPGEHEVSVSAPGKRTYKVEVGLREGETRTLEVTLEDERHGSAWPWIIGGAVVAAGAAVGGYLLFRPQEQQQAGVPAGTLGTVQFKAWIP